MARQLTLLAVALMLSSISGVIAWGQKGEEAAAPVQPVTTAAPAAPGTPAVPGTPDTPGTPAPAAPSLGTPPGGATPRPVQVDAPPPVPEDPDKVEVSIAFAKADLTNVLNFLSLASGVPIVVDAEVKGQVTITSMHKVTLTLAYAVINSALRVRGYTMVGTLKDKMIRVVTLKKAIADRAVVQVGADVAAIGMSDAIITQVIPLQYIAAGKLREELKPLVADDQANLLAVSSSNTLIVTDTEGNVRRLVQLINLLDKDTSDIVDVEVYACKHASATILIAALEKVFGVTSTPRNPQQPGQPNPQPNQGGQPSVRTDDGVMSLKGELRLSADERTNSIIISAARPRIALVLSLVHKLDVSTTSEVRPKVFRLTYADATTVASQLNSIFEQPQGGAARSGGGMPWFMGGQQQGGARQSTDYAGLKRNVIVADVRTNSVVVTATAQNMKEFEAMIAELDAPNVLSDITRTFPLKFAKASDVASTLTSLFRGNQSRNMRFFDLFSGNSSSQQGDPIASLRNITLVADVKTNTLLVTGPPQAFAMVESIIAQLDRRTPQVFIEVVIVDVSLDDSTKFGVEWSWANDPHSIFKNKVDEELGTAFDLKKETLGMKYSILNTNLKALLYALTTRSNVQVKSVPSITTADNVAAKISIGQDEPFVSSETETTGGNIRRSVDFKNVSITLNVTPRVSEASGLISLDVQQTINELMGRESELNAPIIANREAKTTVTVSDGQTIVIGGIIKENVDRTTSAVPVISKIPVIGELFKSTKNMKTKSELMVFITPHILRDEKGIDEITARERGKLSDPKPLAPETTPPTAPETK